jgi:hypothetical protein
LYPAIAIAQQQDEPCYFIVSNHPLPIDVMTRYCFDFELVRRVSFGVLSHQFKHKTIPRHYINRQRMIRYNKITGLILLLRNRNRRIQMPPCMRTGKRNQASTLREILSKTPTKNKELTKELPP